MRLRGSRRDAEMIGDLCVRTSERDEPNDLLLPRGEAVVSLHGCHGDHALSDASVWLLARRRIFLTYTLRFIAIRPRPEVDPATASRGTITSSPAAAHTFRPCYVSATRLWSCTTATATPRLQLPHGPPTGRGQDPRALVAVFALGTAGSRSHATGTRHGCACTLGFDVRMPPPKAHRSESITPTSDRRPSSQSTRSRRAFDVSFVVRVAGRDLTPQGASLRGRRTRILVHRNCAKSWIAAPGSRGGGRE